MTDRYERIRLALAMGPTPGPWLFCPTNSGTFVKSERLAGYFVEVRHCRTAQDVNADANLISACDPDTIRELLDERDRLAAAIKAAREDDWQPIETAPTPDIGANGFGKRLLLVVDCGDGTIPSVRIGYWEGADWYLDCCKRRATACGYRVTHWRPLPEPPAIDRARRKAGQEARND